MKSNIEFIKHMAKQDAMNGRQPRRFTFPISKSASIYLGAYLQILNNTLIAKSYA